MLNNPQSYVTIQVPANGYWPPIQQSNQSTDFLPIFHDLDVPDLPILPHAGFYNGNPRLLPDAMAGDPLRGYSSGTPTHAQLFQHRSLGSVSDPATKMLAWDGAVASGPGTPYGLQGTLNYVDDATDGGQYNWGHCFSNPPGFSYYALSQYGTPIALGNNGYNSDATSPPSAVTKTALLLSNQDDIAGPYFNPYYNFFGMRFRHGNNTSCNTLFADGHVERRQLGDVLVMNVCVNP